MQLYHISYALLGPQGNAIALAHPDEPYVQKYGRFGKAPVPRSRIWLEYAAHHNLPPHLYPARIRSLRGNATAENLKRRSEDGKKVQTTPANGGISRRES